MRSHARPRPFSFPTKRPVWLTSSGSHRPYPLPTVRYIHPITLEYTRNAQKYTHVRREIIHSVRRTGRGAAPPTWSPASFPRKSKSMFPPTRNPDRRRPWRRNRNPSLQPRKHCGPSDSTRPCALSARPKESEGQTASRRRVSSGFSGLYDAHGLLEAFFLTMDGV